MPDKKDFIEKRGDVPPPAPKKQKPKGDKELGEKPPRPPRKRPKK